jgi:pimeloyl-ACP methyl ester carboxylesterase
MTLEVILLPGGVMPANLAYGALLQELGDDVDAVARDLEVYASPEPPVGYTLDHEIAGVLRTAQDAGFDRFHLVGYSGGGASSLAFAAKHRERLLSLALIEPAWMGNDELSPEEQDLWRELDRIATLPPAQMMPAFVAIQLAPGVEPPPPPAGPRRRGWRVAPLGCAPSSGRSGRRLSTSTACVLSSSPCATPLAGRATPTTTRGWPTERVRSSRTSP